jgi:hypothetical protein
MGDVVAFGANVRAAQAAPTPINPGEYRVPVTVTTRWRLLASGAAGAKSCR